ncbi:MAG: glycogen-binding domain-containing protein [Gemmatimonadota bacterium]
MGRPLGAQRPVVVEIGVTAASFPADNVSAVGPSIRLSAAGVRGTLYGGFEGGTVATVGAATGYATLEGGVRTRLTGGWLGELAGELSTVAGSNSSGGAGTALVSGRALWLSGAAGGWLRGSGHLAGRTHAALPGAGIDLGGWWRWPLAQLSASIQQEWTRAELFTGQFRAGYAGTAPVRYTEATVALHGEGDVAALDVSATIRRDPEAAQLFENAVAASAALWTGERVAFVLTAARQLPDWVRGSDAADVVSIGMRFRQATPSAARADRLLPLVQLSDSAGLRYLRVRAAGARTVDVMGDFTEWTAQSLARTGSLFEKAYTIASGSHRILLRIDGGAWKPAANTPAVDDDLGGRVGLLVVP